MKKLIGTTLLLHLTIVLMLAQSRTRRMPGVINHPSLNIFAPYISHDGNALLFVSDNGEDGALTVSYTSRENDWTEPVELSKNVNHRLVYQKGFGLSADGKKLYFTSIKSPVVGGYDIMSSELKGSAWTEPVNLMLPINTKTNEACPSFTVDGNTLYFMRCDKMDQSKADGCKLFVAEKKSNGQWGEAKELPPNINTGNSQAPRIMADSETLIFSSNKMSATKGGMDLYVARLKDGNWSDPVTMDFVNTEKDDQFVAVAALGRYLIKEAPGPRKNSELVEFLIPNALRPKGMMKIEGKITDESNGPIAAYITVTDLFTKTRVYSGRPSSDGSYAVYLREGTTYELSFDPEQSKVGFYAKQFDLTSDKIPQREKVNVVLKSPAPGDEFLLGMVQFKPSSSQLQEASEGELKRLVRMIRANPQLSFEIQVMLSGYAEDSIKSSPDLSEVTIDSLHAQVEDIDSLGQLYKRDTIMVKNIYHNNRTLSQANVIVDYLKKLGVNVDNLRIFTNAIAAVLPEDKKLTVKAVARDKKM